MKIEKGRSIVKLHIKNWSGSELKADFEMDELKAREVSRALYVAQTGRQIDSDNEMIRRLKDSGYPEADEIAHRLEWIVGMNKLLSCSLRDMETAHVNYPTLKGGACKSQVDQTKR